MPVFGIYWVESSHYYIEVEGESESQIREDLLSGNLVSSSGLLVSNSYSPYETKLEEASVQIEEIL